MPHLIIIAGSNGSGKSTTAPALLKDAVHINYFVNADKIAEGLSAFEPEKAAIKAGRIMLNRIKELASDGVNFAFETTLASRTFLGWVEKWKSKGYQFHLVFFGLKMLSSQFLVLRIELEWAVIQCLKKLFDVVTIQG